MWILLNQFMIMSYFVSCVNIGFENSIVRKGQVQTKHRMLHMGLVHKQHSIEHTELVHKQHSSYTRDWFINNTA